VASRRGARATGETPRHSPAKLPLLMLVLASLLVVTLQVLLFDIDPLMALLSVPLAVALACMAARVVGATGIPPIGATGQLSQLTFGVIAPGQVSVNLMAANTAGGAAGQCTDLLNDFRVGHAIGAKPYNQLIAQCLGILVGSVVGVLVYQILIPDPQGMLITQQWPAPAVATWKAVAEVLGFGLASLDASIRWAMLIGALCGVAFGILEASLPAVDLRPVAAELGGLWPGVHHSGVDLADDGHRRPARLGGAIALAQPRRALHHRRRSRPGGR